MPAAVVVVSGPPRSGTSLLMRMLEAGGVAPLQDEARAADAGNPHGYYELAAVKGIVRDASFLEGAEGRAVKIVHALVGHLPAAGAGRQYRVLWLERDLAEVVRSQRALLDTLGRPPEDELPDERVAAILGDQLARTAALLDGRDDVARLVVPHRALVSDALAQAQRIDAFLGGGLDTAAMARAVDPALYRARSEEGAPG